MSELPYQPTKYFTETLNFSVTKAVNLNSGQLHEIVDIEENCRLSRWSEDDYQIESNRQDSVFLIAEKSGNVEKKIIGFILLRINPLNTSNQTTAESCPDADLLNFGVTDKFQNMGIGSALFKEAYLILCRSGISTVWLEVRESNFTAVKFYEKRNFVVVQVRKNFYTQPLENALLMKLNTSD